MSSGFDMEASQPLQLRRGSDANQRKQLLDKYNQDLNESADGTDYNPKRGVVNDRTGHNTEISMERLDEEIKGGRSKKVIYISVGAFIGLIVLTIILVFALKGSSNDNGGDDNPKIVDYIYNPYTLNQDNLRTDYSSRYYKIGFDQELLKKANLSVNYFQQNKTDCQPIYNATLKTSMTSNYRTLRVQLYGKDQYAVPDEWLNPSFTDHQFKEYLNHNEMNPLFSMTINQNQRPQVNQSAFHFTASSPKDALYKETEEFLTTKNQELFLMERYQHISFEIKSKRFMGWGERVTDRLFLDDGNYTIFPQIGGKSFDNGTTGQMQGAGAHPFLMFQISGTSKWAGIFLFNSNPMSLELNKTGTIVNSNQTWSRLTIRTTGGNLDFFVFYGPTYMDVIRQYQEVVGQPKMMPTWAHGLFSSSPSYQNLNLALEAVQGFKDIGIAVSGLVLPLDYENSYFDGNTQNALVDGIRKVYSPSDLQLILPFTTFVSNFSSFSWVKSFNDGYDNKSFSVRFERQKLEVEIVNESTGKTLTGYCMDVFNPRFMSEFLEPALLRNMKEPKQGYWLKDNLPYIRDYTNSISDPLDIPYRPGQAFSSATLKTIPESATHEVGNDQQVTHFYLHALFGSKLATQFIENLYPQRVLSQRSFVISDSTYSGLGRTGAAHLLQAQNQTYADLQRQLNGMILMNMYGIPNTGAPICSTNQSDPELERLCVHYFALSVIQPLAFYSDLNNQSLDGHPFKFQTAWKNLITQFSDFRTLYLMYQREQLKKIETSGGAFIRPAFTEFESLNRENDSAIDMGTVMFGDSILASFQFYDIDVNKTIILPQEANWLQLSYDVKTFKGGDEYTFIGKKNDVIGIQLFQKSGTIIAYQGSSGSKSIALSVVLQNDNISNTPRARGYVYIEGPSGTGLDTEYHEVYAENNIISFKQQDVYAQATNTNETNIAQISVAFSPIEANFACALKKDLRTVQQLYVVPSPNKQSPFVIFSRNQSDPVTPDPFMKIDEIEHIFYGFINDTKRTCEQIMFGYRFISNYTSPNKLEYTAYLIPNIMDLMPLYATIQKLEIFLTGNNSLTIKMQDTQPLSTTKTGEETKNQLTASEFDVTIDQILDEYIEGNYCFALRLPNNVSFQQDYFSTCDSKRQNNTHFQLHHLNLGIFNFDLPNTQEKYVSGLGERKGSFFLENGTTYAFYNNDNNLQDSYQAHGRRIVHGRNGYHNIIYAKHGTSRNSFAIEFASNEGREITYGVRDSDPCFAVQSSQKEVSLKIYFDMENEELVQAVFKPMINKQGKSSKLPPAWAFGHHATVPQKINQGLIKKLNETLNVLKIPLEGIVQEIQNLDQGQNSMSFDPYLFTNEAIKYMVDNNLSLVSLNTPTYPIAGKMANDPNLGPIFNQNLSLTLYNKDDRPYLDYSKGGRICYLNNLLQSTADIYMSQIDQFISDHNLNKNKFGLSNYQNEISRPMCVPGSCWDANFDRVVDPLALKLRKPGNQLMTYDTLDDVSSYFQKENSVHNLEGSAMNSLFILKSSPSFIISQSKSIGSTLRGQVARVFDYYQQNDVDMTLAVQQLQQFSYQFGIPMVSIKFARKASLDKDFQLRQILLNTFTTTAAIHTQYSDISVSTLNPIDIVNLRLALRVKYSIMAYTRTQVFRQMNTGIPVIRPMHLMKFDAEVLPSDSILNMYMFGPAILAQPDYVYSGRNYPYSNWCSVHGGISEVQICFNNQVDAKYDYKQMLFINQGSITPLYSFNRTEIADGLDNFKGSDNLMNLTLDLHVFNNLMGNGTSRGELLMDDGLGTVDVGAKWCYLEFEMIRENYTIVFNDMSQEFGQTSKFNCNNMRSYQLNQVTLYDYKNFTDDMGKQMQQANITLRSNTTVFLDLIEVDPLEAAAVFQVRSLTGEIQTVNYFDIDNIKFSSEVPQPPNTPLAKKKQY